MMWLRVRAPQVTRVPQGHCFVQATEKKYGFPPQLRPWAFSFCSPQISLLSSPMSYPKSATSFMDPCFQSCPPRRKWSTCPPPHTHTTGAVHTQQPSSFFLQPRPHRLPLLLSLRGYTLPNSPNPCSLWGNSILVLLTDVGRQECTCSGLSQGSLG